MIEDSKLVKVFKEVVEHSQEWYRASKIYNQTEAQPKEGVAR